MQRRLTIRAKILLIAFGINALCTGVYTVNSYVQQRQAYLDGVDKKLRAAAYALPQMLSSDYHDRIKDKDSIKPEEHAAILKRLSLYAEQVGLTYLYSYMEFGGKYYVASTSATKEEMEKGTQTPFFKEYEHPPELMLEACTLRAVRFSEYKDEWGHFRSIFVPMKTPAGTSFVVGADRSLGFIQQELRAVLVRGLGLGVSIFILVWLVSYVILNRLLAPVGRLSSYTRDLTRNNFQFTDEQHKDLVQMAGHYKDEVGQLAAAFSEMDSKLQEYIRDLKTTTAVKERIESELKIAHDIQMSFLPKIFPPFPQRTEFDLYAAIEPAKEVGGDLYDFVMLDDDHIFFYVGDVSDKGVPAALFMAVSMTLMKRTAQQVGINPAEILRQVNEDLVPKNESLLFVTLFCAILNVRTGEVVYSNAGHNPPVVMRKNGTVEWLKLPDGIVLGVMPGAPFTNMTIQVGKGDTLLLYTDGVTEAMNPTRELYSEERLEKRSVELSGKDPAEVVKGVVTSVKTHANGAPQSDDITVLALKLR